jgi:hypothetical protein
VFQLNVIGNLAAKVNKAMNKRVKILLRINSETKQFPFARDHLHTLALTVISSSDKKKLMDDNPLQRTK